MKSCDIGNPVHIGLNIQHQILFCNNDVLQPIYIVSKMENILPIRKFSKVE